ncbi:protein kinase [Streptomyces sp. 7-21]|uniref:protein kinase domain-containing protein n=1 Tax=Streptomyces sp. 7-21 TaxID=2802283 RepID=UPI001F018793|nr:protein kinase [Streptomyces sp. 7-21]
MWGNNGLVGEGRYRLTHRIGRGGMAEVFAAEDVRLGRPVAIKLLRPDLAEDPVSKARFTREAQSVAGLNHHAVVAVYDSGEEYMTTTTGRGSVVPYMVMELINGRTIRDLLVNAEAPPVEQALRIVSGVLEALAYSHQHGIVHRDIKPANVIITDTGSVKVMDFGIARALHGAAQTMTQTGMVMGTPQYLSPEQALGKTIDTRSDLYAVGCLLYELLALRPPFTGETPLSVVYQHVQDTPRLPSEVSPSSPPELDGLVMRALAKDPDDRFQSAEEMRGLVQYALRMLEEHGGHTGGLWNTGPTGVTGTTPAMGTPAPTRATRAPGAETPTGQLAAPMLLGDPDEGGAGGSGGGRTGGRGRLLLVALLAVVAIGTGVLVAANLGGDSGGNGDAEQSQTDDDRGREDDRGTGGAGGDDDSGETPSTDGVGDDGTQQDSDYYQPEDPSWSDDGSTPDAPEQSEGGQPTGDDTSSQPEDPEPEQPPEQTEEEPDDPLPTDDTEPEDPTDPTTSPTGEETDGGSGSDDG